MARSDLTQPAVDRIEFVSHFNCCMLRWFYKSNCCNTSQGILLHYLWHWNTRHFIR